MSRKDGCFSAKEWGAFGRAIADAWFNASPKTRPAASLDLPSDGSKFVAWLRALEFESKKLSELLKCDDSVVLEAVRWFVRRVDFLATQDCSA